jgi:hypothetical protein
VAGLEANLPNVRKSGRPAQCVQILVNLIEVEIDLYRLGEAREHVAEIVGWGIGPEDPALMAAVARVQGRLLLTADEPGQAADVLAPALELATKSGLGGDAHRLRAYLGQAKGQAGDSRKADALTTEAIHALDAARHMPALADACVCRTLALNGREDPDVTFRPVIGWFEHAPARLVRMTYILAAAEHARNVNAEERALQLFTAAREMRDEIGDLLSPIDRNGLEVHPWTTRIFRGLPQA